MGLIEEKKEALKQFQTNLLFKREGEGERREERHEKWRQMWWTPYHPPTPFMTSLVEIASVALKKPKI